MVFAVGSLEDATIPVGQALHLLVSGGAVIFSIGGLVMTLRMVSRKTDDHENRIRKAELELAKLTNLGASVERIEENLADLAKNEREGRHKLGNDITAALGDLNERIDQMAASMNGRIDAIAGRK